MLKKVLKAIIQCIPAAFRRLCFRMGLARECEATVPLLKASGSQQEAANPQTPSAAPTTAAGTRIAVYRRHSASSGSPERQMVSSLFRNIEHRIWWSRPEHHVRTTNATFPMRSYAGGGFRVIRRYPDLPYGYASPFRRRKLRTREQFVSPVHERFVRRIVALQEVGLTPQEIAMLLNCRMADGARRS